MIYLGLHMDIYIKMHFGIIKNGYCMLSVVPVCHLWEVSFVVTMCRSSRTPRNASPDRMCVYRCIDYSNKVNMSENI